MEQPPSLHTHAHYVTLFKLCFSNRLPSHYKGRNEGSRNVYNDDLFSSCYTCIYGRAQSIMYRRANPYRNKLKNFDNLKSFL